MMVRVTKAVRRLARRPEPEEMSGAENEASWQQMLSRVESRDRDIEQRLSRAERALNRRDLS